MVVNFVLPLTIFIFLIPTLFYRNAVSCSQAISSYLIFLYLHLDGDLRQEQRFQSCFIVFKKSFDP